MKESDTSGGFALNPVGGQACVDLYDRCLAKLPARNKSTLVRLARMEMLHLRYFVARYVSGAARPSSATPTNSSRFSAPEYSE